MVIAERKPLTVILDMLKSYHSILIVGCGGCMTVGLSGGAREVGHIAEELSLAYHASNQEIEVLEHIVVRQCEEIFLNELDEDVQFTDVILSLGCGVGVQALADRYPEALVLPALDTRFIGMQDGQGTWVQRCQACGECIVDYTGGICPVSRCPKNLLNGPCGGSQNGMCEIGDNVPCVWSIILDRMERRGEFQKLSKVQTAKNWGRAYGSGKVVKGGRHHEGGK